MSATRPESAIAHHEAVVNGIRLHWAEAGDGPLVVLLHGFPETWLTWRHQLPVLAAAGFRAVAPDLRGFGESERPRATAAYRIPSSPPTSPPSCGTSRRRATPRTRARWSPATTGAAWWR